MARRRAGNRSKGDRQDGRGQLRVLLPALVFTALTASVVSTLGAPMVPTIAREQHVPLSAAQWVLTSTLLAGAIAGPVLGRLGDGPRRRVAIQGALTCVLVGSVLAALAPDLTLLLAGRTLQGAGMGLLPLTIAVAREHLSAERIRSGITMLSVTTSVGAGVGYPLTGVIAQHLDYRSGFWFAALLGALSLLVVQWVVPPGSSTPRRPLDVLGAALLCSGLALLLLAVSQGVAWGMTSSATLGCLGAGAAVLPLWIMHALRARNPLVDIRVMRNRAVLAANATALLTGIGMYSVLSLVNLYTQVAERAGYGFHLSLTAAGLVLLPMSLGSLLANRLTAALVARFGLNQLLPLGSLVITLDLIMLALWREHLPVLALGTFLLGVGVGAAYAVMPLLIVRHVPPSETGSATSFNQVLRTVGGSLGSAAISALMLAYTPADSDIPEGGAYTVALLATAAATFLGVICALVLPPRRRAAQKPASGVIARDPTADARTAKTASGIVRRGSGR